MNRRAEVLVVCCLAVLVSLATVFGSQLQAWLAQPSGHVVDRPSDVAPAAPVAEVAGPVAEPLPEPAVPAVPLSRAPATPPVLTEKAKPARTAPAPERQAPPVKVSPPAPATARNTVKPLAPTVTRSQSKPAAPVSTPPTSKADPQAPAPLIRQTRDGEAGPLRRPSITPAQMMGPEAPPAPPPVPRPTFSGATAGAWAPRQPQRPAKRETVSQARTTPQPAQPVRAEAPRTPAAQLRSPQATAVPQTPPRPAVSSSGNAATATIPPVPVKPPRDAVPETPSVAATSAALASSSREEAAAPTSPAAAALSPLARGRELTALLYGGQLEQLWTTFLPAARARWGSFSAFQGYRAAGVETYGAETSLLNEGIVEDEGGTTYTRTVTFAGDPSNEWTLMFGLDDRGNVRDFQIVTADLRGR